MLKHNFILKLLMVMLFGFNLYASNDKTLPQYNEKAQIILETIQGLEKSGYITEKNAVEAKKEFVFSKAELLKPISPEKVKTETVNNVSNDIKWTDYLSLINIMKILAVIFLLIAFRGVILKFIILFASIPQYVYQTIVLGLSLSLTFYSDLIWLSQAKYLSMFGVVANIIVLTWIVATYEDFVKKIVQYISLNMPVEIVVSIYLTLYFGFFAIYIDSSFLGVLTMISFVSIFSFTMSTTGLCTYIGYNKEDFINQSLFVNLLMVVGYSIITIMNINIPHLEVFSIGIEYVLTTVLVITLVIMTSFAFSEENMFGLNLFLFTALFVAGLVGSFLYNLQVIPSIINTGFLIFLLGWLHYFTMKISGILTMFMAAITLYLSALLLESHPEYFVTRLF